MQSRKVSFENSKALKMAGVLDYPDGPEGKLAAVIIAHGLGSSKEYTPLHKLSHDLVANGFVTLRFDFSNRVAESKGYYEGTKISEESDEIVSAISFLESVNFVNTDRIGVVGHSLGGLACIVAGSNEESIKAIVTLASPSIFEKNELNEKYDASKIVKNMKMPIRIIHGSSDDFVSLEEGKSIFENANEPKDLKLVEGADHDFKEDEFYNPMSEAVVSWMKKYL